MTAIIPQRAPETRGAIHPGERGGDVAPQPLVYERRNGEQLRFRSVESFRIWWCAQERRREIEAEAEG